MNPVEDRQWTDLMGALAGITIARVRQVWELLGLASELQEGPRDVTVLAAHAGAEPRVLHRMLRLLAYAGDVTELVPGVFALPARSPGGTPGESKAAVTRPAPLAAMPLIADQAAAAFTARGFMVSLFTGKPAFRGSAGTDVFAYFGADAGMAGELHACTEMATTQVAPDIVGHYDFSRFDRVVDVGGGSGALIGAILRACASVEGVVFDGAAGCAKAARELAAQASLAGRWTVAPGDFFDAVPGRGDVYLLKSVLHDWDDDRAVAILRSCHRAMPAHGRLLVIEPVLPGTAVHTPEYLRSVVSDLICLLMTDGGRERTETEFRDLLAAGGFAVTDVVRAAPTHFSLIEAVPVLSP